MTRCCHGSNSSCKLANFLFYSADVCMAQRRRLGSETAGVHVHVHMLQSRTCTLHTACVVHPRCGREFKRPLFCTQHSWKSTYHKGNQHRAYLNFSHCLPRITALEPLFRSSHDSPPENATACRMHLNNLPLVVQQATRKIRRNTSTRS